MEKSLNKKLNGCKMPDSVNENALNQLITAAAKKLGMSPDSLRKQLENGSLEKAIMQSNTNNPQTERLKKAISDPKAAEKIMRNPETAELLKKLTK
jgi:hypothetical protein